MSRTSSPLTKRDGLDWPHNFIKETIALIERIEEWPRMYATIDGELRAGRLKGFPFLFVYQVSNDHVEILSVSHAMRDDAIWRERMSQ
jgi:hypothetical protein